MENRFEQMSIFGTETNRNTQERALNLREQFTAAKSFDHWEDTDILQMLISLTGRRETAPVADALMDSFGSIKAILEARPEQLQAVNGVNSRMATLIASFVPMFRKWQRLNMDAPERISNSTDAEAYCKSLLTGQRNERFYVIALNAQCQVLGSRMIAEGSLSEVSAYPRSVMETALNYNAHNVLFTHNHPGGTCAASREDIASTQMLQKLLNGVGILVLDHIIVAGDRTYSMIRNGDIDYRIRT